LLRLADKERTASACLDAVRRGHAGSEADRSFARTLDPAAIEKDIDACGARVVIFDGPEYPAGLDALKDPPAILFVRGRDLREIDPAVAVVGARNCSALGEELARDMGRTLAREGCWVVSGAARGIDSASHEGALEHRRTAAVLGCGIDVTYPLAKRSLLGRIAAAGALVSEYPPGVPAEPFRFPARNRLVAGLARALVVVEGAAGSGSLITADHALEIGRTVFAVPGVVTNPLTQAPHELIREGATLIRGVGDLLHDLGLPDVGAERIRAGHVHGLTDAERVALSSVRGSVLPDAVARALDLPLPEAISVLMTLEMKGLVRNVGGRIERRPVALR
ncbi:MAG: DNA-processing protein DprA, partial [Actinomycetota bacterium]|nr:DNA-processing protein DprA [Actinomycetota bacterium]